MPGFVEALELKMAHWLSPYFEFGHKDRCMLFSLLVHTPVPPYAPAMMMRTLGSGYGYLIGDARQNILYR